MVLAIHEYCSTTPHTEADIASTKHLVANEVSHDQWAEIGSGTTEDEVFVQRYSGGVLAGLNPNGISWLRDVVDDRSKCVHALRQSA